MFNQFSNSVNTLAKALTIIIFVTFQASANDGAFYMRGNHLIPITENQICISKEILSITKKGNFFYVDVDYTFNNPGKKKEVLMGFEAPLPVGAAYPETFTKEHPYMKDFTVLFNGKSINYKSDLVETDAFQKENQFKLLSEKDFNEFESQKPKYGYDFDRLGDYIFVNYFTVQFEPGNNKIHHTYSFRASGSVDIDINFEYILTAANRWAGGQIDDFTLNLKMEDFSEFYINQTFFKGLKNWKEGSNMKIKYPAKDDSLREEYHIGLDDGSGCLLVRTRNENLQFHQKNFHPEGELVIWSKQQYFYFLDFLNDDLKPFDVKNDNIEYELYNFFDYINFAKDDLSLKLLRNYPFAIRGYAFKNKEIRSYYESTDWYKVDPNYDGNYKDLYQNEKNWLEKLKLAE